MAETVTLKNDMMDMPHINQVLAEMQVGIWVIELPREGAPKMYGNATMYTILGANADAMTPEGVYAHWTGNIDPEYMQIVTETVEAIKQGQTSEVKYLWRHPKQGWIWVRCGGYLDETYQDGFRFKGWHYDVSNELETGMVDTRHHIVDEKKLKMYSPYVIENIAELYEIDSATLRINTVFFERGKYRQIQEDCDIFRIIQAQAHPDYVEQLKDLFRASQLEQMMAQQQTRQMECKILTVAGDYGWAEFKLLPVTIAGTHKLLLCISDISDRKKVVDLTNEKNEIMDALTNIYTSIAEVNLSTETAVLLKCEVQGLDQKPLPLTQLHRLTEQYFAITSEKITASRILDAAHLRTLARTQEKCSLDFQVRGFRWKRVDVLYVPGNRDKVYLATSDVDQKHLMDSVLQHFVFDHNDYLYYVDAKNNSFLSFHKNDENVVLPPQSGDDYENVMIEYTKQYVVPEDQDRAIEQMRPSYMMKRLQTEDSYRIESGMLDIHGNYRRKEVTVQIYDRENQIFFTSRRDVTKEYFRQKNQKESLANARKMANTDMLTGLYNREGARREIEYRLDRLDGELDAFVMLDLDNFKAVNDNLGHQKGDELLQKVGGILEDSFRKTDTVARLGGDEFIVYMKDIKDRAVVVKLVEKLIGQLQLTCPWGNGAISVSASAGIALAPVDAVCFEDLYVKADKALYDAKGQGKNRFSFFKA